MKWERGEAIRIVFFGTPHFARTILDYLFEQGVDIAAVITRPDKPKGRSQALVHSPVKEFALEKKLSLYQPNRVSEPEFAAFLKTLGADFFIVAAYAEILKEFILEIPRLGCINVHGSLLPKYRGAAPVQRALIAGESTTGVTIMKMASQMDAGDILAMRSIEVPLTMNAGELMEALADLGKVALLEVLHQIEKGEAHPICQDPSMATHAKKIRPEDGEIDWNMPCLMLHNLIRGVNPNPGAWCWVEVKGEKKRFQIKKTLPDPDRAGNPGEVISAKKSELVVGCQQGALKLLEVQLEGKKVMPVDLFLRGVPPEKIKFLRKNPST